MKKNIFILFLLFSLSYAQLDKDIIFENQKADKAFEELNKELSGSEGLNLSFPHIKNKAKSTNYNEEKIFSSKKRNSLNQKILFKYCGLGKTEKEARINALKGISEQITVKVKSSEILYREREYIRNKINIKKSFSSLVSLESQGNLKGVIFSKPKIENNFYKVCAYFTGKSLKTTINYLISILSVDFSAKNKEELEKLKSKTLYLITLAQYLPKEEKKKVLSIAKSKLEEINKYLDYGSICINTIPENAKIIINNKEYKPFSCIYLPPNKEYLVKIQAPGYKEAILRIYLTKGEKFTKTVELPKKVEEKLKVFVFSNNSDIEDKVKEFLSQNNFEISSIPLAPSAIFIIFKDKKQNVYGYTRHIVTLTIKAYRGPDVVLTISGKVKPFYTTLETEDVILQKKLNKLLRAVLIKFINKLNYKKLKGEEEFDYGVLLKDLFSNRQIINKPIGEITLTKNLSYLKKHTEKEIGNKNYQSYLESVEKKNQLKKRVSSNFKNLKEFVNYIFKSLKIENVKYELYKPDPDTETYKGVNVKKELKDITFKPDKYYLKVYFSTIYPKNYLRWIHPYLSKISEKRLRNILPRNVEKYKCAFFINVWPSLKVSEIINLGYILPKKVCKIFLREFDKNLKKRKIVISFADDFNITLLESIYKYANEISYSFYSIPYLAHFKLENFNPLDSSYIYIPFPIKSNFWRYKTNMFLTLNLKKDIVLKGYIPKDIAENIKKFEVKLK